MRSVSMLVAFLGCLLMISPSLAGNRSGGTEVCSNDADGIQDRGGYVCCRTECETCGGRRCNRRFLPNGLTYDDCCQGPILHSEVFCDDTPFAPCIIKPKTCPRGTQLCMDPHIQGLNGQHFEWHGADGEWYCLVKDDAVGLQVNVRPTAPLPEFPERQYITGISVMSNGHSLVIEVKNPYSVETEGCLQPSGVSPCLAEGGLRIAVDGEEVHNIVGDVRNDSVADGMSLSATNLPVECREFGGSKLWASMLHDIPASERNLESTSFEDWVLNFDHMAAPEWCQRYVMERGLTHVHSKQSLFRIATPTAVVRFATGVNHRSGGKMDSLGRTLPALDFWQTGAGVDGLSVEHEQLTGILGETAHPVVDEEGHVVMEGLESIPGTIENYRVSGPLGTDFPRLLHKA